MKADVSNEEDIKALAETALKEFGHVDIWVNNAGVEASFPTIDMPLKEWQRVIDVNLNGVFWVLERHSEYLEIKNQRFNH